MIMLLFTLLAVTAAHAADPQITLNAKVLSIPARSPALLSAGLVIDPAGGMQNLGLLSPERAKAVIEVLNSAKGVELLSTPTVTTKDQHRATIEMVREFIYPTEFDPGTIKNLPEGKPITLKPGETVTAIPATPTAFEMRPLGIRIEFQPTLLADGSIDLVLAPELVSFEGLVNFGKPIQAVSADEEGNLRQATVAESNIQQPVFQSLKTTTTVNLQPGQCLLLGGLAGGPNKLPLDKPFKGQPQPAKPDQLIFFMIEAKISGK